MCRYSIEEVFTNPTEDLRKEIEKWDLVILEVDGQTTILHQKKEA